VVHGDDEHKGGIAILQIREAVLPAQGIEDVAQVVRHLKRHAQAPSQPAQDFGGFRRLGQSSHRTPAPCEELAGLPLRDVTPIAGGEIGSAAGLDLSHRRPGHDGDGLDGLADNA
jgi:hypothetical protein